MPKVLSEIGEKLQRADESITNLHREISAFNIEKPNSGISKDDEKAFEQWAKFHAERKIPDRFGVIAGEIIHHLRSCLDHIAWALSSEDYRREHERAITFPICISKPATKQEISSYNRKIKGISSMSALKLIESVQPYNRPNPTDDPLAIVHELDRIDKHHTLVLVVATFNMGITIPLSLFNPIVIRARHMNQDSFVDHFAEKIQAKITRQVAFSQFGERENQPVVPALTQLANAVSGVVHLFTNEL